MTRFFQWVCGLLFGHRWGEFPRSYWRQLEPAIDDPIEELFNPGMREHFREAGILLCHRCGAVAKRHKARIHVVSPGSWYSERFNTREARQVLAATAGRESPR